MDQEDAGRWPVSLLLFASGLMTNLTSERWAQKVIVVIALVLVGAMLLLRALHAIDKGIEIVDKDRDRRRGSRDT